MAALSIFGLIVKCEEIELVLLICLLSKIKVNFLVLFFHLKCELPKVSVRLRGFGFVRESEVKIVIVLGRLGLGRGLLSLGTLGRGVEGVHGGKVGLVLIDWDVLLLLLLPHLLHFDLFLHFCNVIHG